MPFPIEAITDASWSRFGAGGFRSIDAVAKDLARHDLEVVRPALLYGDSVVLRTGNILIQRQMEGIMTRLAMPLQGVLMFARICANGGESGLAPLSISARIPTPEEAHDLLEVRTTDLDDWFTNLAEFAGRWEESLHQFLSQTYEFLSAEADSLISTDLDAAVRAGILEIRPHLDEEALILQSDRRFLDVDLIAFNEPEIVSAYQEASMEAAVERLRSSSSALLLDPWSKVLAEEERAIEGGALRSIATSFGLEVMGRLTNVGEASVAELLDMRSELEPELVNFRSVMFDAGEQFLESGVDDPSGWLQDYTVRQIEPALQEIAGAVRSNTYLNQLLDVVSDPRQLVAPGGALLLAAQTTPVAIAPLIAAGLGLGLPLAQAERQRRAGAAQLKGNRFLFIHRLRNREF